MSDQHHQLPESREPSVPDVVAPGLTLLFVGINPGLLSAALGCNFARPGNRFWPALHGAGFTAERLVAAQQFELLKQGLGITNIVARTTAKASELSREELRAGRLILEEKIRRLRPRAVAILGVGAYRDAFDRPKAKLGLQAETVDGIPLWVLPNPSGLNAHFQLPALIELFRACRDYVEQLGAEGHWAVWRQDDNGNRFLIQGQLSRADAEAEVTRFTALGHKQLYWAERE